MTPHPRPVRSLLLQTLLGLEWGFAAITGVKRLIGTLTPSHSTLEAITIGSGLAAIAFAAVVWQRRGSTSTTSSDASREADIDRHSRGRRFLTAVRFSAEPWCLCLLPGLLVSLCLARHSSWAAALGVFLAGTAGYLLPLLTHLRRREAVSMESTWHHVPEETADEFRPLGIVSANHEFEDDDVVDSEPQYNEAELDEEEADASGVCQRVVRRATESGESIDAVYTVSFAAGSSHAALHMTFQPPFAHLPHVNAMVVDSEDSVRLSPAVVYRYGARIDLRRAATASEMSAVLSVEVAAAARRVKAA
ncbi:MAG: hypothetical protein IT428_12695 [Planctomycetaceae bacterium]|nr:hypothetical protein [Planctomycetaceae bacterium]